MELKAKVTSKGQLTIPKEVRRALGVRRATAFYSRWMKTTNRFGCASRGSR